MSDLGFGARESVEGGSLWLEVHMVRCYFQVEVDSWQQSVEPDIPWLLVKGWALGDTVGLALVLYLEESHPDGKRWLTAAFCPHTGRVDSLGGVSIIVHTSVAAHSVLSQGLVTAVSWVVFSGNIYHNLLSVLRSAYIFYLIKYRRTCK